ncbi:MAG TPA: SpvB/TcaC N-terminal domain-containing protein, partial [Spirochaetia bacterium]|nr:SpvB/TcaC N-terminal domain-containing protein [Spirochaetia bacterium]
MRKVALLGFLAVFYLAVSLAVFGQSVSASGSLTYEYPIKTPPGAGGMAPSLSLVYDSAMGNGILGMGWAIKGLSAITRDPTYQITFNDDLDHFLYDGQKLVKGADGLYQTKTETFLRIQFVYPNSTASYWTVTDKRGRTIYFGDSSDSHVDAVGRPGRARVWAESRLQDTMGNYITVTYNNETSTGAYYPDRILYTKNDTNQPLLFNAINFSYEPRADAFSTYMPSGVNTNERLRWVSVLCGVNASGTNGTLVRKYSLDYRYSISTGRTQLVSIREYGNDGNWPSPGLVAGYAVTGTAGPETRFSWGPADERNIPGLFLSQRWATQQGGYWDGQRWMIADVNGDGLPDLINVFNDNGSTSVDVHLSTGTG